MQGKCGMAVSRRLSAIRGMVISCLNQDLQDIEVIGLTDGDLYIIVLYQISSYGCPFLFVVGQFIARPYLTSFKVISDDSVFPPNRVDTQTYSL